MVSVSKPNWWAGFASFYGFSNDSSSTIDSGTILSRLNTYLVPAPSQFGNYLLSTQGNAFPATARIDIAVLNNSHNFLSAQNGSDFISGRTGDDVLYGDAGMDIFHGGAGNDLIIGNNENPASTDRDTLSYLDATSGVTVLLKDGVTFVSNDGSGSYDFLYGIDNLFGSDFVDRLDGNSGNNIINGGRGDDRMAGGAGNDVLDGGEGNDRMFGDSGNDIIISGLGRDSITLGAGQDKIVFDAAILGNIFDHRDLVYDFQTGSGGDKLDITALLHGVGYQGSNPIGDGYLKLTVMNTTDIKVSFDADGTGSGAAQHLITLAGQPVSSFSATHNLISQSPDILYAAVLGQSNAKGLSTGGSDNESGITRLRGGLLGLTDYDQVVSVLRDTGGQPIDIAVGGTTVDGNRNTSYFPDQVWWYPDQNKPGELAMRAVEIMAQQIADLRAQGVVTPIVIWGQGEAETRLLALASNTNAALERYKNATLAVFDYIKSRLGADIEFYIMETGRYNVDGARQAGESQSEINIVLEGVALVRKAQQDMAIARDDVHLAADYADLRMLHDSDPATYPTDVWHMDYDDREIIGDRLAGFIAADLGYSHVIQNPGPYPVRALADLAIHPGSGGSSGGPTIVNGTSGNDTLSAAPGGSIITGGQGKDSITLGAGLDTVVFGANLLPDVSLHADFIRGFKAGPGGDKLDISGLLAAVGYTGSDPIADGYLKLTADGTRTTLSFDSNGPGGAGARYLGKLVDVAPGDISVASNLIITPGGGGGGGTAISGLEIDGFSTPDLIIGTSGADIIRGLGGNDMIVGAHGADRLYGGSGKDDFIFDASVWSELSGGGSGTLPTWADIIEDFSTSGGDQLDITILLEKAGYTGSNPVGDGYFSVTSSSGGALARFDADGSGGSSAVTIAQLVGVSASSFSYENNLTATPQLTV